MDNSSLLRSIDTRLAHIESVLSDPQIGMVVRLDRLEQLAERRKWQMRAVIAAGIGVLAFTFRTILSTFFGK